MNICCLSWCLLFAGCFEVTIPADEPALDAASGLMPDGSSSQAMDALVPGDWTPGLNPTDIASTPFEDIELPAACSTHCDCPQGWDCTNERCVSGTLPIYCCTSDGCPTDAQCWSTDGNPGVCTP